MVNRCTDRLPRSSRQHDSSRSSLEPGGRFARGRLTCYAQLGPAFSGSARLIEAFEVERRTLLPFSFSHLQRDLRRLSSPAGSACPAPVRKVDMHSAIGRVPGNRARMIIHIDGAVRRLDFQGASRVVRADSSVRGANSRRAFDVPGLNTAVELTTRSNSVLRGTLIVYGLPGCRGERRGNRSYAHRVSRRLDVDAHRAQQVFRRRILHARDLDRIAIPTGNLDLAIHVLDR